MASEEFEKALTEYHELKALALWLETVVAHPMWAKLEAVMRECVEDKVAEIVNDTNSEESKLTYKRGHLSGLIANHQVIDNLITSHGTNGTVEQPLDQGQGE